ncbi:reverse transcriptase [Gossypium australe]|uniref:Reverse transcriptase n=1 Tax=Gossypium australe TaxID=47621 RepID=A0A5B6VMQ6_9ROSI|nr:reverse transcriptase [Gossypium australe]
MGGERNAHGSKTQNFRFEAKWCLDSNFEELIKNWWAKSEGNLPKRGQIELAHVSDDNLAEIAEIQLGLNLEVDKEELFWEQRARVNWLQHRDRNTNYFHKMAG